MLLEKGALKICSKFTGKHPYQRLISINLQSPFYSPARVIRTLNQQAQNENDTFARNTVPRVLMFLFKGSSCFCCGYECEYIKVSKQKHVTFQNERRKKKHKVRFAN